jgi:tRNA (guanine-N7-)-methyltransferase
VTPAFVTLLADTLVSGARVYCCSDVRPLAAEMQALYTP